MITLLSNVAIQDTSNTANIVYLNNIMEGVDGAATFGYTLEPTAVKVDDNQTQQYMHDHTLDIRVLQGSSADLTKLKVIDANNTPVVVSGYSPDGFFVIDDPAQLTYHSQFDSVIADRVLVTTTGVNGYGGAAPGTKVPVYAGDNLLAVYNILAGSTSYVNGFDQGDVAGLGVNPATGAAWLELNDEIVSRKIFFPFPGQVISIGGLVQAAIAGTARITFKLEYLDASLAQISEDVLPASGSSTIQFLPSTVPANTVYIVAKAECTNESSPGFGSIVAQMSIRLQGSTLGL